ncbi:hypothetical protein EDD85DRAFT_793295 [Armillaria nabsnona]|nr:hypothetical protein EDD85DRAFT_793295 [Armillaria nabsnona]
MSNQQLYDPYRGLSQQIGRTSHETRPRDPAILAGPQPLNWNLFRQRRTYGLQTQTTHGARQRLLYPITPTGQLVHGPVPPNTSGSEHGTSLSQYWTPPTSPNPLTQFLHTSSGWHWEHQGPTPRYYVPVSALDSQTTLGQYPFLSVRGYDYDGQQIHQGLGLQRIPTLIPTRTLSSSSNESDSDSEPTSKPGPSGPMNEPGRIWFTSSPSTEGTPSILEIPPIPTLRHEPMPTDSGNYIPHTQATYAPIYTPELRRSSVPYNANSFAYPDYRVTAPTWMAPPTNPFEGFEYVFKPGFEPSQITEDIPDFYVGPPQGHPEFYPRLPEPLPDSPLNPQHLRYYLGRRTSQRITGAGLEEEMEGVNAGGSGEALAPNNAQCLQQAHQQAAMLCTEIDHLNQELEQAKKGKDRGQ